MTIIYKCLFGSRLYGTDGEGSDTDYKEIYLPSRREILLGKTINAESVSSSNDKKRNGEDDFDVDRFTFQKFVNLLYKGEQNSLDILFSYTNPDAIIEKHPLWDDLILNNIPKLISRNARASIGYMRSQTNRYVVRGTRMSAIEGILNLLNSLPYSSKLSDHKEDILNLISGKKFSEIVLINEIEHLSICERKAPFGNKVGDTAAIYQKLYDEYGERTKRAAALSGVDLKGISHCIRIGEQLIELLETGSIKFPLKNSQYIKDVKYNKVPYEDFTDYIESLFDRCNYLVDNSTLLPDSIDREFLEDLIIKSHSYVIGE